MSISRHEMVSLTFSSKLILLFLAVILSIPVVAGFFTNHEERSSWENRPLTQFPQWHEWKDAALFFNEIDRFSSDHIGFALPLNRLYRKFRYYIFSDSPIKSITVGSSGFVYLNSHNPQKSYTVFESLCIHGDDANRLQKRVDVLGKIFFELESRGYKPSVGIPVSKPVLYPDNLSSQVPHRHRDACTTYRHRDNIPKRLGEIYSSTKKIIYYPLDDFYNLRNQEAFFPKENFHWNGKSSHVFARDFLSLLDLAPDEDFSKGSVLRSTKADLKRMMGFSRNIYTWHYPYARYKIIKTKIQELAWIKNYYKRASDYSQFETGEPISKRRALVISNSFGAGIARHLAAGFQSLLHVNIGHLQDDEYRAFFADFIDTLQPTDIIFIFHDDEFVSGGYLNKISQALVSPGRTN
jgi:hypothetical protein